MSNPKVSRALQWLTVYLTVLAVVCLNIVYTNRVQTQTEQAFCTVVNLIVVAFHDTGVPATPLGRQLLASYIKLQHDLGCVPD